MFIRVRTDQLVGLQAQEKGTDLRGVKVVKLAVVVVRVVTKVGYSTNQGNGWFWLVLVGFGWFLIKLINSQPKSTKSALPLCI